MNNNIYCTFILTILFFITWSSNTYANKEGANHYNISAYVLSTSFSNILPIKQLITDDWEQAPATDSNIGFSQNEVGLKTNWGNVSFNIAHRLDYFVFTNPDTAQAFYLDRTDQSLTTQKNYQLALKLHHQRSNGFRLGYQWQLNSFTAEVAMGYWDVTSTRKSQLTGEILADENNNITAIAELNEHYSHKNFLKRENFDRWDIEGYGLTVDIYTHWQVTTKLNIALDIKDLYSIFKMKNLGYSEGNVDTEGTFINSLGGQSYLPLYRGKETSRDYQFGLPENINLIASYQNNLLNPEVYNLNYVAHYKRQGTVNFYYAGVQLDFEQSTLSLMLDLENLFPELKYKNKWVELVFATDKFDLNKAMQFTLGVGVNYTF